MEKIAIISGKNAEKLTRMIRRLNVYCEVLSEIRSLDALKEYEGIIIDGDFEDTVFEREIFELSVPVLALCSSAVSMAKMLGAEVSQCSEVKTACDTMIDSTSRLFSGISGKITCFMNFTEQIEQIPVDFKIIAKAPCAYVAAMENAAKRLYALQFSIDNIKTREGMKILSNFLFGVCGCEGEWTSKFLTRSTLRQLKQNFTEQKVFCLLDGSVKSTLSAVLLSKAAGSRLICLMPDTAAVRQELLRKIEDFLAGEGIRVVRFDCSERILGQLLGISDCEQKQKTVSRELARIASEQIKKLGGTDYLVSTELFGENKSDSYVQAVAQVIGARVIKPLACYNFEDTLRAAKESGIPDELIFTSTLPEEGCFAHISGIITREKLLAATVADGIFTSALITFGKAEFLSEFFIELTSCDEVSGFGKKGFCITLCAKYSSESLRIADVRLPYELLEAVSRRILGEIPSAGRVLYDITPDKLLD